MAGTKRSFSCTSCIFLLAVACVALSARPSRASGYTSTRYPIVLVPGAILFELPFDAWTYWYGIVDALQEGGATVYVSRLPVGNEHVRGEILREEVENILAISGHAKVNLIGYSQGAQTCRYLAATLPEAVASVTTVAGPHQGSPVADFLLDEGSSAWRRRLRAVVLDILYKMSMGLSVLPHQQVDMVAAITALSSAGAEAFNQRFPVGLPAEPCQNGSGLERGQRLYSWGGVGHLTNLLDLTDPLFLVTSVLFHRPNDGMVDRCSSHFGHVIRDDFRQNHFDGINQTMGLAAWRGINPRAIYRAHANRLQRHGL